MWHEAAGDIPDRLAYPSGGVFRLGHGILQRWIALPSLALFVSSPAVIALAWRALAVDGEVGFRVLLFTATFFAILTARLSAPLARAEFSIAWWAYTFPSGALANGFLRYAQIVRNPWTHGLAWFGLAAASAVLLLVAGNAVKAFFVATPWARTTATMAGASLPE